jgi:hypothetical protein
VGLREDVLRQLTTEYQQTKSTIVFEKILKRVDNLLLKTILICTRTHPHFGSVDLRDLYHTAIVGLGRALITARPQEDGGYVAARIIAYVRCQLHVDFPLRRRNRFVVPSENTVKGHEQAYFDDVITPVEFGFVLEKCSQLQKSGFLSDYEMSIVTRTYIEGKTPGEIGQEDSRTERRIYQRLSEILELIRRNLDVGSRR